MALALLPHAGAHRAPRGTVAQHNREVQREAGLDDSAIHALYANGTTADASTAPPDRCRA